jgi:hypothetical protein
MVASYKQLALASRGCRSEERNQENAAQDATAVHGRPCSASCL